MKRDRDAFENDFCLPHLSFFLIESEKRICPDPLQADNWLRTIHAFHVEYQVAFVPSALKDGYVNYFENVALKKNYRVAQHTYRVDTLKRKFHSKIISDLLDDQKSLSENTPIQMEFLMDFITSSTTKAIGVPFPMTLTRTNF